MTKPAGLWLAALLYGVAMLGANPAGADLAAEERESLQSALAGDMRKFVFHSEARPRIDEVFRDGEGNEVRFSDFAGKVVMVNLWATWCPPCLAEMPSIDRMAGEMAGDDLAVIALSTDRFGVERIEKFFDEIGVENLAIYQDKRSEVARKAGALGLPVTLLLDREGREIARLQGDAEWDTPEARELLERVIEMTAPGA